MKAKVKHAKPEARPAPKKLGKAHAADLAEMGSNSVVEKPVRCEMPERFWMLGGTMANWSAHVEESKKYLLQGEGQPVPDEQVSAAMQVLKFTTYYTKCNQCLALLQRQLHLLT